MTLFFWNLGAENAGQRSGGTIAPEAQSYFGFWESGHLPYYTHLELQRFKDVRRYGDQGKHVLSNGANYTCCKSFCHPLACLLCSYPFVDIGRKHLILQDHPFMHSLEL